MESYRCLPYAWKQLDVANPWTKSLLVIGYFKVYMNFLNGYDKDKLSIWRIWVYY